MYFQKKKNVDYKDVNGILKGKSLKDPGTTDRCLASTNLKHQQLAHVISLISLADTGDKRPLNGQFAL